MAFFSKKYWIYPLISSDFLICLVETWSKSVFLSFLAYSKTMRPPKLSSRKYMPKINTVWTFNEGLLEMGSLVDFITKYRKGFPIIDREGFSEGFLLLCHHWRSTLYMNKIVCWKLVWTFSKLVNAWEKCCFKLVWNYFKTHIRTLLEYCFEAWSCLKKRVW